MNPPKRLHKAAFLDRDGVINHDHHYVCQPAQFEFIDGVFAACRHLQSLHYQLIVVTNQSGIARGYYSEAQFLALSDWMQQRFLDQDVQLTAIYHCPHLPGVQGPYGLDCDCRKPRPGMLLRAIDDHDIDATRSLMVGDKAADLQAAAAAGVARRVLVRSGQPLSGRDPELATDIWSSLHEAVQQVLD